MKRMRFLLFLVAAMAAWCPASFAQQTCPPSCVVNTGSLGVTQGVSMTGAAAFFTS